MKGKTVVPQFAVVYVEKQTGDSKAVCCFVAVGLKRARIL